MIRKDFKFKLVKNFLTEEEVKLCMGYIHRLHHDTQSSYSKNVDQKHQDGPCYAAYGDPLMETLMLNKLPLMEKETGLKLFPTYSWLRVYTYGGFLQKHKDRPSCEISVSVMFGSDGKVEWPLCVDGTPVVMKPGDAVIYLGCELEHYRTTYKGDYHAQAFIHYVDANGPNADYKGDLKIRERYRVQPPIM